MASAGAFGDIFPVPWIVVDGGGAGGRVGVPAPGGAVVLACKRDAVAFVGAGLGRGRARLRDGRKHPGEGGRERGGGDGGRIWRSCENSSVNKTKSICPNSAAVTPFWRSRPRPLHELKLRRAASRGYRTARESRIVNEERCGGGFSDASCAKSALVAMWSRVSIRGAVMSVFRSHRLPTLFRRVKNRVPSDRPAAEAICGVCKSRLFKGEPVALTAKTFDKTIDKSCRRY